MPFQVCCAISTAPAAAEPGRLNQVFNKDKKKKMDGIVDRRKRRNGRWSQKKKVKRKQIWNSQLGRNVNKKKENRNSQLRRNINQWKKMTEL